MSDKVRDFVTKYSTLATFFCDFFSCRVACSWVAARAISSVAGDATIFQKIASPVQAKNRTCGRGFTNVISMIKIFIYARPCVCSVLNARLRYRNRFGEFPSYVIISLRKFI